mmetsp:Transcript_29715/g.95519  ORF Transcript_29715/g.95519 Transcript_29715/m.95519 type:complete len:272 (-) Transcript_29715:849-1664(-)
MAWLFGLLCFLACLPALGPVAAHAQGVNQRHGGSVRPGHGRPKGYGAGMRVPGLKDGATRGECVSTVFFCTGWDGVRPNTYTHFKIPTLFPEAKRTIRWKREAVEGVSVEGDAGRSILMAASCERGAGAGWPDVPKSIVYFDGERGGPVNLEPESLQHHMLFMGTSAGTPQTGGSIGFGHEMSPGPLGIGRGLSHWLIAKDPRVREVLCPRDNCIFGHWVIRIQSPRQQARQAEAGADVPSPHRSRVDGVWSRVSGARSAKFAQRNPGGKA